LSPCPGRAVIEQLAPVYACVMGVCLQLAAYAAWWSCMESVAIRQELQARPARWCASWGRPKLTNRAAEWGSVSSCSRSAALAIKTPCTHRCWRGKEKYIRQRVCAAAFGRNSCLDYCSSSSSSICCVRLSVRALLRADDRSQQEPTVDPNIHRTVDVLEAALQAGDHGKHSSTRREQVRDVEAARLTGRRRP
jgi:hypothetical protein